MAKQMVTKQPQQQSAENMRRCPAMIEAGIKYPSKYEGIVFCTTKCPYDTCIIFDDEEDQDNGKDST